MPDTDAESVAQVLQATVLDHIMRVSYGLAAAVGSGGQTYDGRLLRAIDDLDEVAGEVREIVVALRHDRRPVRSPQDLT